MLAKENRIRLEKEYQYIFRNSKKIKTIYFDFYLNNCDSPTPKFGIIVSNKYGNAVKRNKIRRQIRAIIRTDLLQKNQNKQIIIQIKPEASSLSFSKIKEILLTQLAI